MPYDEKLFQRVLKVLKVVKGIEPKTMFGGICFMHNGNMLCGIDNRRLMVRVGPDQYAHALSLEHASEMDITGKPMTGFIFVKAKGYETDSGLKKWLILGLNFTSTLPQKNSKKKTARKTKNRRRRA